MENPKKEIQKILPLALLFGTIGGILLIIACNNWSGRYINILLTYSLVIGGSVYLLNRFRLRHGLKSTLLYGYIVYTVMTLVGFFDLFMNAQTSLNHSSAETLPLLIIPIVLVAICSGFISLLFRIKVIH